MHKYDSTEKLIPKTTRESNNYSMLNERDHVNSSSAYLFITFYSQL